MKKLPAFFYTTNALPRVGHRETSYRFPEITDGRRQWDRLPDGNVPRVNFNRDNGKVYVNADNPQNADDNVRFRREVSRN